MDRISSDHTISNFSVEPSQLSGVISSGDLASKQMNQVHPWSGSFRPNASERDFQPSSRKPRMPTESAMNNFERGPMDQLYTYPSGWYPVLKENIAFLSLLQHELQSNISRIMSIVIQQNALLSNMQAAQGICPYKLPPPPPPPPKPAAPPLVSSSTQTEILSGDIDAIGDRLVLYRIRLESLDAENKSTNKGMRELRKTLPQMSIKGTKEIAEYESTNSGLRRENNRLIESVDMLMAKVTELNRIIEYYKNFENN